MGVMGHHKRKGYAWDVVNEALNDEDAGYRQSIFYKMYADNRPTAEDLEETMRGYVQAGVAEVMFTEVDVRFTIPVNEANLGWQKDGYPKVSRACVKVKECVGITSGDFYDPLSWIPDAFPGKATGPL